MLFLCVSWYIYKKRYISRLLRTRSQWDGSIVYIRRQGIKEIAMEKMFYSLGNETEQVEFKKNTGELKETATLNKHDSGDRYFGVKNNGDVIG